MPRHKNIVRSLQRRLLLPEDLSAQIDLTLYSPLEGKVPYGAFPRFIETAAREQLARPARMQEFYRDLRQMSEASDSDLLLRLKVELTKYGYSFDREGLT